MAVIFRAQAHWRGFQGPAAPLHLPANFAAEPLRFNGGATIDTLYVLYDHQTNSAWIGAQQVVLPSQDNVVLVDRMDGVGGPMVVVGTARVGPYVSRVCGSGGVGLALSDELKGQLEAIPSVHEFWQRQK